METLRRGLADLESLLAQLFASRAYGASDEAMFAWLAAALGASDDPTGLVASLHADDAWLAVAAAEGHHEAMARVDTLVHQSAASAAARTRLSTDETDELRQRVREKLLVADASGRPKILQYAGRAPLSAWIRVVAVREALTARRRTRPETDADPFETLAEAGAVGHDPALDLLRARFDGPFRAAFERAVLSLEASERNVLRLHLLDGLSIDEIGGLFQVHRATAARWIARSREAIAQRTRAALVDSLQISATEVDSLIGVMLSRIDVSIARLLGPKEEPPDPA